MCYRLQTLPSLSLLAYIIFFVFRLDFYYILTCQSIKVLVLVLVLPVGRMAQKIIGFVYLVIAPTRDQKTVSKRTKHIILETQK